MTNENYASLIAEYNPTATQDKLQEKLNKLNQRTTEKLNKFDTIKANQSTIAGLYDADSPIWANPDGRKATARLTGNGYYVNAPELKVNDELTQAGINARIQADSYAMGVDAPNFPEGEGLDPKYYQQYVDAINPAIAQRQADGQYEITSLDIQDRYGRELVTAQSSEMPLSQTDYLLEKGQGVKKFTDSELKKDERVKLLDSKMNELRNRGRFEEAIDLAQSEGLRLWADMSKAARSASRSLVKQFGIDPDSIGLKENTRLLGTDELVETIRKNPEVRDAITGYGSRAEWVKEQTKFQESVKDGKYGEAAWNVVTNLDRYLAQSAPEMALLMTPYAGLPSLVGTRVNSQMEEFEVNNGRPMTTQEAIGTAAAITATLVPEKLLVKTGATSVLNNLTKGIGGLKKGALGVTTSTAGEALQEGSEAIQEQYATQKIGDRTLAEIATSPETVGGVIAGGVMGGALRGAGETGAEAIKSVPDVIDATKKGIERATETPVQKKQRETREFSTPLQEEATSAILTGDIDTVVDRVEKVHGKLVDNLDPSANKKRTYGTVIKNALVKAVKSGDEAAIKNVYKTMAELDKSDADFDMKDMVDEFAHSATMEFLQVINKNQDTTDSKLQELKGKSIDEVTAKATAREDILAEARQLEALIELEEKRLKDVRGSDDFERTTEALTKLKNTVKAYIEGKDLETVNSEFAELGFIVAEGVNGLQADPNRPGLAVYERELQDQLLNPKINKNLLDEKVNKGARVRLTGLTNFAESRLKKLNPTAKKEAFQTVGLINSLFKENEQMLETINTVLKTAQGLKSVDKTTRKSYEDELKAAAKVALEANKELTRRKATLDSITDEGTFVFQVNTDGSETIQKVTGKDSEGKFTKVKYADVVDDKVIILNKPTETATNTKNTKPVEPKEVTKVTKKWVQEQLDAGKSVEEVRAIVDANSKLSAAYRSNVGKYLDTLVKPEEKPADVGVPVEQTKAKAETTNKGYIPDKTAKKEEYYAAAPKKVEPVVEQTPPKTPLSDVRVRIAYVNEELSDLIANVPDMDVKKHVKEHYTKKLEELQEDRTKLGELINRLEKVIDSRIERQYTNKDKKLMSAIVGQIDKLISSMLKQLSRLNKMLKKANKYYGKVAAELRSIMNAINEIETEYTSEPVKTTIGKVTKIDEELYGVPVVDFDDTRIVANKRISKKTDKAVDQSTAINDALESVKKDKMIELRNELKDMPKGETSLSAKLIGRLLLKFPMSSSVHKIIKRGNDSVFGKLTGNTFANPTKLLEVLPKSFKEFFASDKESREALIDNIETMAKYLDNTKIGDIKIGKNRLGKHINLNGLAMLNRPNPEGGEYNFPVEVLELIGTVKDGILQIDEQTENILNFYTAKMLGDSQTMIGKVLSFDESEMSQYLGIADPDEQIAVKQEAAQGYVNSASIRKDIGSEVYQALGIRFTEITPEFTEESFKSALGVLVQAIATDNGSMSSKSGGFGGKNQTLVKVTWDNLGVEKEPLIKAINKLQYMNENRNRPLPSLRELADDKNRKVMNTQNQMDQKSIDFLNKQEKIAYTISPRLKRWLEMDEAEALKSMEYVDVETAGLHVSEIDAQIARNDKLVREWDILKTFAKSVGNKKFYTKWGQTVSGRYTILSDIQYQESKLHREFVVAEGSVESVDPKNADVRQMLEASIMQGLDMDPDKLSAETAREEFKKLVKVTDNGIEIPNKLNKEYKNKIILANAGTGKSYVTKQVENVVDGDELLVQAVNQLLKDNPTHKQIKGVSVLNDVWMSWGKGSDDKKVLAKYEKLRAKVYEIQAELAKKSAAEGNTVLIASSRPAILEIVDTIVYQGDTETLRKSRASKDRENVLLMSAKEVENKNEKFLKSIKGMEDKVVKLEAEQFLGDVILASNPVKRAYETLRDTDKIDIEASAEVFADSEGHHGISSIELLVDWDKALKEGTKIETHANLEIDAITSGMILTLLQIGSDQAIRLAEKGGIYTKERKVELEKYVKYWLGKDVVFTPGALIEAGKKHASAIEKGTDQELLKDQDTDLTNDKVFKDLYSTIGVAMVGEVKAYKKMLEDKKDLDESETQQLAMLEQIGELNVKNIRSIAKSPVMVYIYGATISSIKKKLTYSLGVDTLVKAIKTASKLLKTGKDAGKELEFIKQFIPEDKENYVDGFGMKVEKPTERWEQLLALDIQDAIEPIDSAINATFGTGIETAFSEKLGFVDRNRDAAKSIEMLVFQAYQIKFSDEVKKMLDEKYGLKHKGETYKLSKEDLQNINNRLTEQGFGHNIVWYEDGETVNQSLNKTGNKGGDYSTNVTVGNTKVGGQIKQFKPLVNTGAAPTISIHAIDGRMMLDVLNRELGGKYTGGNVYDAVVLSLNKVMLTDTADSYNTNMIETGFSRSVVADQLTMLENMLNKMSDEQIIVMSNSIGLRPEGELKEDFLNEMNRLNLSTGKMLERIELAEEVNKERLINSANGYYSGHLFQMGSGIVEISASKTRAKEFPVITVIKKMLNNRMAQDRKVTNKEFGGKLDPRTDYVFNLNDITERETQVKSKANIAQMKPYMAEGKEKIKVTDRLWDSLSANDTVEIIGYYKLSKRDSRSYWFNEVLSQMLKSDAGIITTVDLSSKGRKLVNGVWVKLKKETVKELTKQQDGKMTANEITNKALECKNGL